MKSTLERRLVAHLPPVLESHTLPIFWGVESRRLPTCRAYVRLHHATESASRTFCNLARLRHEPRHISVESGAPMEVCSAWLRVGSGRDIAARTAARESNVRVNLESSIALAARALHQLRRSVCQPLPVAFRSYGGAVWRLPVNLNRTAVRGWLAKFDDPFQMLVVASARIA